MIMIMTIFYLLIICNLINKLLVFLRRAALLIILCAICSCATMGNNIGVIDNQYIKLQNKYHWLTPQLYKIIKYNCDKYKLKPALVAAIIQNESEGKNIIAKNKSDIGYMQVNKNYHLKKGESPKVLLNPIINIERGCGYLSYCKLKAHGNLKVTLKNYNSGVNGHYYRWAYINRIISAYEVTI
jgi:hypothetical protein